MDFEKLSLANEVWHWAHGFANMFREPLQPFGTGSDLKEADTYTVLLPGTN